MTCAEKTKTRVTPYKYSHHCFFSCSDSKSLQFIVVSESCCIDAYFAMTQPEDTTTSTMDLLKEMKEQMVMLTSKVETLQQKQASDASLMVQEEEDNEDDKLSGSLVSLSESTHAFLEAAFSTTLTNADRKKRVDRVGVRDCNSIRCPKLDPVIQTIAPNEATKADGYLSHLQQFWLDATAPLTAIIETAEEGKLTPELAVSAAQTALVLMGNAHQHMAQERRKRLLMNLNPALKSMANDKKSFKNAAPMLFGDEFAKLATERVDQLKAISKFSKPEQKKSNRFFGYHPQNSSRGGRGGGNKSGRGRFHPYSKNSNFRPNQSNLGQKQ